MKIAEIIGWIIGAIIGLAWASIAVLFPIWILKLLINAI